MVGFESIVCAEQPITENNKKIPKNTFFNNILLLLQFIVGRILSTKNRL
jgi:hypothetical protein